MLTKNSCIFATSKTNKNNKDMKTIKIITTKKEKSFEVTVHLRVSKTAPWAKEMHHLEILIDNKCILKSRPISKNFKHKIEELNSVSWIIAELGIQNKIKNEDKKIYNFLKKIYY